MCARKTTQADFEVEEQSGVLNVLFEEPGARFVITPNTPVRQIWISALATSFKLDWNPATGAFILPRTGEPLIALVDRLIGEHHTAKPWPPLNPRFLVPLFPNWRQMIRFDASPREDRNHD